MTTIILAGAGRMGGALLRGWMAALGEGVRIYAVDPHAADTLGDIAAAAPGQPQFCHAATAADLPQGLIADAIVAACKPQLTPTALQALSGCAGPETLVVSVAAGVPLNTLQGVFAAPSPAVRAMPNIGAMLGRSATAAAASSDSTEAHRALAERLFRAVGSFSWLAREEDLHTVTALSGSGPAYVFAMCEAMIAAAQAQGLDCDTARTLAIATVTGAGRLLQETPDPARLRETVTSPNGTTAAGLQALGDSGLADAVFAAITAAGARSRELS